MRPGFYANDVAHIHDRGFLGFARRAAPAVLRTLRGHCGPGARVVEIGCGSGGLTERLVGAGYRVLGVDVSPAMIRLARQKAPAAELRVASWYDFVPPPCDAMVAVGECFNYRSSTPARHRSAVRSFLRRAARALPPDGIMLFDFLELCPGHRPFRTVQACGADWAILVNVHEDRTAIIREITAVRFAAGRVRCSQETHRQVRLSRGEMGRMLRAAGFSTVFRDGYGKAPLGAGRVVAKAVKGP